MSVGSFDGHLHNKRGLVVKVRDVDGGQLVSTLWGVPQKLYQFDVCFV